MKIKSYIVLLLTVFFLSIHSANAWLGLFAQNGDIISTTKWNEMITKLETKLDQSNIQGSTNIDVVNSWTWVIVSFTWSVPAASIPYITSWNKSVNVSTTKNINITGLNFVPSTSVSIPSWPGTINSTTINGPTDLDINITATATTWTYDLVISNSTVSNTLWTGNWVWQLSVLPPSDWKDLRLWWDSFTDWNWAWNDIRYRAWMSMTRDTNGMYFSWSTPWSSWVKFESLAWTRWTNKTLEWIYNTPSSNMMIWIWSDATNETATDQYRQAETEVYFQNSTTMYWLYWNNWTVGTAWNQANNLTISSCASWIFKQRLTNDGTAATWVVTIYCLPSASQADWDDTATVMTTFTVGWSLNPNEPNLMPFIIPQNAWTQRFIAVKVD